MNRCVRIDRGRLDLRLLNANGNSCTGVEHINNSYAIAVLFSQVDQFHGNDTASMAAALKENAFG